MRLRARLHLDERGFTLIETVIAITIIFASLVAAAYAVSAGFGYNALARERQAATGIANQIMEEVRALAWDRFTQGLADSDLTGDANILPCVEGSTTVYRYKSCTPPPAGTVQATGAKIVHTPGLTNQCTSGPACPLVPHRGTIAGSPLTYTWSAYVTNENPKTQPYMVTVVVTWSGGRIGGVAKFIQVQTVAFNPKGCGGDDVHAFAGPCTYYHSADATVVPGRIDFATNLLLANGSNCPGPGATCVSIVPQAAHASVQSEQGAAVQSTATQGGVECAAATPNPCLTTKYGEVSVSTSADSNPITAVASYGSVPSLSAGQGSFTVTPGTGTTLNVSNSGTAASGSTVSATAPTSISTNPCPLTVGLLPQQTDALPCAASVSRPGATTTAFLNMTGVPVASSSLGNAYMMQINPPPTGVNAANAFIDRKAPPDPEDAMRATAVRTFGTMSLFQLPSTMSSVYPAPWTSGNYLITLTGYSDQASAAAGAMTIAPTAAISAGTISYWNGSSFTSTNVSSLTPGQTIGGIARNSTPWLQGTGLNRRWVCATITPTLTYAGPSTPGSVGSPRTSAKASMGAPIKGTVDYRVDIYNPNPGTCTAPSGLPLSTPVNLTVSIDLGTAQAAATYKPAPRGV